MKTCLVPSAQTDHGVRASKASPIIIATDGFARRLRCLRESVSVAKITAPAPWETAQARKALRADVPLPMPPAGRRREA